MRLAASSREGPVPSSVVTAVGRLTWSDTASPLNSARASARTMRPIRGPGEFGDPAGDHAAATGADQDDVLQVLEEQHVGDLGGLGFGVDAGAERVAALGAAVEGGGEHGMAGGAQMRGHVLPDPAALIGAVQQDVGCHGWCFSRLRRRVVAGWGEDRRGGDGRRGRGGWEAGFV